MVHRTLGSALAAVGMLFAATVGAAQEDETRGLRPTEVRGAQLASQWVLGAQQQERAIAEALDPEGLAEEIQHLRRAVRQLQDAERAARLRDALPEGRTLAPGSASATLAAELPERRQRALDRASRLASRRAALASDLAEIPSRRQRGVARAMAAKLGALEQALQEAVRAPSRERATRLGALRRRLTLERPGVAGAPRLDPTPTFQMRRRSELPPLRVLEE